MADEPIPAAVETQPPEPPAEPLDESGVPYKNRVAEWQRKAQEAETRAQQLAQVNEQYMAALGQQRAAQPAPPTQSKIEQALSQYQPQDRAALSTLFQEAVQQAVEQAKKETEAYSYKL